MNQHKASWLRREKAFAAFATGLLLDFWHRREEREFIGVGNLTLRYVRFTSPQHRRVILIVPGRIESYIKYPELAYDLFHCGFDVVILDHRGQGRSDRLLEDSHRGHVAEFTHYVDDLETLYLKEIVSGHYQQRYALAHSMGGAILTLFLARQPQAFHAVALVAPMFGIVLPLPSFLAHRILDWAEKRPAVRDGYALGTGCWRAHPFGINRLTHSAERYRRSLRFYADDPVIRVGGPTYHWVHEGIHAGRNIISQADKITTPLLLLQASDDQVVDNRSQDLFCAAMAAAGHPCEGNKPRVINGARHEILFEKDDMRAEALNAVIDFFHRIADVHYPTGHGQQNQIPEVFMYHIVASDLDGTLLSPEHRLNPFARETLQQLVAKDIHFVFATGRHHIDVGQMRDSLAIPAYMITSNGARVHNAQGELVFSHNLDEDIANDLFGLQYHHSDILTHVYRDDEWFVSRSGPAEQDYFRESVFNYQVYEPGLLPTDNISKVFFTCEDPEHLIPMEKAIEARWGDRVNVSFSLPTCLEVMAGGVSKGHALEAVAKQLGHTLHHCIAFGDGMNDVEMLSMAGKGYIMQNAHQRLKDTLPELEVIGSNADDAVPQTLRALYLS